MDVASDTPDPETSERRRIGEIFVELDLVTPGQLAKALETQGRTGGRIGQILVEQGAMTRLDLASALAEYWEPQRFSPVIRRPVSLAGAGPLELEPVPSARESAMLAELEERLRAAERRLDDEHAHGHRKARGRFRHGDGEAAESAADLEQRLEEIERRLDEIDETRRADALAVGARLASLEAAVAALTT